MIPQVNTLKEKIISTAMKANGEKTVRQIANETYASEGYVLTILRKNAIPYKSGKAGKPPKDPTEVCKMDYINNILDQNENITPKQLARIVCCTYTYACKCKREWLKRRNSNTTESTVYTKPKAKRKEINVTKLMKELESLRITVDLLHNSLERANEEISKARKNEADLYANLKRANAAIEKMEGGK